LSEETLFEGLMTERLLILAIKAIDPKDHCVELLDSLSIIVSDMVCSKEVKDAALAQMYLMKKQIELENKGARPKKGDYSREPKRERDEEEDESADKL
jgi:hypothetical protein